MRRHNFSGWAAALAGGLALFIPAARAIDAQIFNGTSNQSLYVYYDTDSVQVGSAVNVYIVGSVSGNAYEFGGDYNRSWEGGNPNFTLDPNGPWGYSLGGYASIDRWMTLTPSQAGAFRVGIMLSSFPNYEQAHAYINFTAWSPAPEITSPTSASVNQGQNVSYQITATNNPTSYGASNLPAGLSVNTSTGAITGRVTASGTINSTITASNDSGQAQATLTWYITAYQITPNASVTPASIVNSGSVTLTRDGTANFGIAWTENVIWKPDGSAQVLGNMALGSMSYTPAAGTGTYWYQFRIVDSYSNYADQWLSFTVTGLSPPGNFGATAVGSTFVTLAWTAAAGADHYEITRNGVTINSNVTGTTFTDSNLPPGTAYTYGIRSVNSSGASNYSTVNLTTAPPLEVFTPLP